MPKRAADGYTSNSQRARRVTEAWGETSLYESLLLRVCERCAHTPAGKRSCDRFPVLRLCSALSTQEPEKTHSLARARLQLRANARSHSRGPEPHFYLLHYRLPAWLVHDLLLIPRFVITPSAILPRKPLRETARRKHWQGYTLDLSQIPAVAKISLVVAGSIRCANEVRADFARLEPVRKLKIEQRGWTLDVLRCVESLASATFRTEDAYGFETRLAELHPDNRHVREKIRQQLQILRDTGFLEHVERGVWRRK